MNTQWPIPLENEVIDLYNMGLSMKNIGVYMKKNKNQVIGKLHRLKRRFPEKFTRVSDTSKIRKRKPAKYA